MRPNYVTLGDAGDMKNLLSEFERCWPWLEASMQPYGYTHSKRDLFRLIDGNAATFWPGRNCALVGEIWNHPTGLRTAHGWLAGGELAELLATIPQFEAYGRYRGCHRVIVTARPGWQRVLDGYSVQGVRLCKNFQELSQ